MSAYTQPLLEHGTLLTQLGARAGWRRPRAELSLAVPCPLMPAAAAVLCKSRQQLAHGMKTLICTTRTALGSLFMPCAMETKPEFTPKRGACACACGQRGTG